MSEYHFDITPHIVKQLGEQLVSDETTALLELIKNSYDADASYVSIEINTTGQYLKNQLFYPNHIGFIVVEDDGFGMSEETIMKSWLLISYSQKRAFKKAKQKTPKGRTPLGDKGLGRLSTQRLADICEIFTNKDEHNGIHIAFNWKDFEIEESLGNVRIQSNLYQPNRKNGTSLILANLNHTEVWEGRNLEKFKGQVSQIISPYKENRPFIVYIAINGISIDLEKSNENLRDLAISKFEFNFDGSELIIKGKTKLAKFVGNNKEEYKHFIELDNGKKFFDFLNQKHKELLFEPDDKFYLGFEKKFNLENIGGLEVINGERANPGPFRGKIDEFSYDNWMSNENSIKEIFSNISNYREFAQSQAGIKIFRNGFAIKPFGIDAQDWLKLSESQTKGKSFYLLRPANVIGYFAIDEGVNHNLKDQTDREGLVYDPYSRNFFTLALFIKDEINWYQDMIRRAYNEFINIYKIENNGIKTVNQAFTQLKETKRQTEEVKKDYNIAKIIINKSISESEKTVKAIKNNPMFSTDLENETADKIYIILLELKELQNTFKQLDKIIERTDKLNEVIDILEPKIHVLEEQLSNFSELASLGLTTESVSHEFASIAERLSEKASFYSNKLQNKKLEESDIFVLMEYINTTVNGLKVQLRHLDPALKYNREKKSILSLSVFFKDEKEYYKNRFEKLNICFIINIIDDFSVLINRGKLTQIIDNILNNSEYWLKQKKISEPNLNPEISIKVEKPWVYIQDNGIGIAQSIQDLIFEPFVTTKPSGEGRGLGLFIVRQLLDASGCSITLEQEKNKFGNKYIFAMNLSNIIS
jgi:signal transduction histidine kinase